MLDFIRNEQRGQEIIYTWAEWLQSSSLSYLGFHEEIMLEPYGVNHSEDLRAISGCGSPEFCIPLLKSYDDEQQHENFCKSFHKCCICFSEFAGTSYDDEQRHENFCKSFHECCICFSEIAGADFIRLPCQHFFCQKCMKTYSDMLIKEGTVSKLLCPDTKCGSMIPPGLLKRLLGVEEFERWETLTSQNTLELMPDVAYCPRCETACIEDEDQHAQCSNCFYSFCTLCRDRRHVGMACMPADMKLHILQARQSSTQLPDGQRQREQQMIHELVSVTEILRDAKQCPSCRMAISRIEGCNKMVCNNCGQYFCYRCSKAITGYEHFRDGSCELFPQEEVQRWEHQMNPRQAIGQIQAQLFADRGHLCPTCGQVNVKVANNNHIFCWACQKHYCYLCRKLVKRSSEHFGPKGCIQHTMG